MTGNWMVFIKNGEVYQAGYNIVPNGRMDAVLPVEEHVAKQMDKLEYDGENLLIKDNEKLLDAETFKHKERENNRQLEQEMRLPNLNADKEIVRPMKKGE